MDDFSCERWLAATIDTEERRARVQGFFYPESPVALMDGDVRLEDGDLGPGTHVVQDFGLPGRDVLWSLRTKDYWEGHRSMMTYISLTHISLIRRRYLEVEAELGVARLSMTLGKGRMQ